MNNSSLTLAFPSVGGHEVVARFDGGDLTSDAGLLFLRQADKKLGLIDAMTACMEDRRQASKVEHPLRDVMAARVFAIAAGYEDANDLDRLRSDPALKAACERLPSHPNLASQPTISRWENTVRPRDLLGMGMAMAERVVAQLPGNTRRVVLDMDATEDACHGQQGLEGFNAFYDEHCYRRKGTSTCHVRCTSSVCRCTNKDGCRYHLIKSGSN
jgi:hypothetical protein